MPVNRSRGEGVIILKDKGTKRLKDKDRGQFLKIERRKGIKQ